MCKPFMLVYGPLESLIGHKLFVNFWVVSRIYNWKSIYSEGISSHWVISQYILYAYLIMWLINVWTLCGIDYSYFGEILIIKYTIDL